MRSQLQLALRAEQVASIKPDCLFSEILARSENEEPSGVTGTSRRWQAFPESAIINVTARENLPFPTGDVALNHVNFK
jgi:ATP-dependent helicase YprA (DUF1998 family)